MTHQRLLAAAAVLAVAATAGPAGAQDYDWTGFYVGGNLGMAWGDTSIHTEAAQGNGAVVIPPADIAVINRVNSDDDNNSGFTGGVQAGYNYQSGSWLFGVETDFGAFDIDQERSNSFQSVVQQPIIPPPPLATYTLGQQVTTGWVWTLRPRVGYVSGPWMVYATAGIASTEVEIKTTYSDTRVPPNSGEKINTDTKTGWAGGLGGAYMFSPNWSVRGEWLYIDFGNVSDTFATSSNFATLTSKASVKANAIRIGVDYKF